MAKTEGDAGGVGRLTIDGYLARSGAGASSLRTYRKILSRCEALHGKPLEEASERSLAALKSALREKLCGPGYARKLAAFYREGGRSDLADMLKLKQRMKNLSPDEILTLPEVRTLIQAADSLRDRALIATLWATGQRVSAICALRLGDVAQNGHGYRVFFRTVKIDGQEHNGYLLTDDGGNVLGEWLKSYPFPVSDNAPLFPSFRTVSLSNGTFDREAVPISESGALAIVKATARRAGITKRVYPHLFRHSRASHLQNLGMNAAQIKRNMGWSQSTTVLERRYSQLSDRDGYTALLKAHGLTPEGPPTDKSLNLNLSDLKPVVPMMAMPGKVEHGLFIAVPVGFDPEITLLGTAKVPRETMFAMLETLQRQIAWLQTEFQRKG